MGRYEDFHPDKGDDDNNKEELRAPPVLKEEIVADGLSYKGRNGQEYLLTIMKEGTFRVSYPETSFTLKDGAYEEGDLMGRRFDSDILHNTSSKIIAMSETFFKIKLLVYS